jgi:hypothetical protein
MRRCGNVEIEIFTAVRRMGRMKSMRPEWLLLMLLPGCTALPPGQADRPLFGGSAPVSFLISSDRPVSVRELSRVARAVRPYKQLSAAEIAEIQDEVRRVVDDLVAAELAGQTPSAPRQQQARARVLKRVGPQVAVQLPTRDQRPAVAFAKLENGEVRVTPTAFEIDKPAEQLAPDAEVTTLEGSPARLLTPSHWDPRSMQPRKRRSVRFR